jgi:hypothetical protein
MRRIRRRLTYANVMSTIAVFAALGGGAYAAVTSIPGADGVVHSCYQVKKGTLRVVPAGRKCSKGERALAFNQRGPQGAPGALGTAGAAGARGDQGSQGPGATTFSNTIPQGPEHSALTTPKNGIALDGACTGGMVSIKISTISGQALEVAGTGAEGEAPFTEDSNIFSSVSAAYKTVVDFDVTVRDRTVGPAARITVQGTYGSPCQFWGMIIPSS